MATIEYAELARKLWPFLAGYVGQYSGGYSVLPAAAASTSTGGGAPSYASFLTLGTDADLSAERVFTPAATLTGTDAGAGSTYTLGVNQASAFTWTGTHTFTPAGGAVVLTDGKTLNGSTTFVSGFAGAGWRIDQGISYASQSTLEVDNVIVRGLMRVYELVINKIRVSRGSLIVSPGGGKVSAVSGSGPYTLTFDEDHGILTNDLLRAQKFTGSGTYQSLLTVTAVPTSKTLTVTLSSGSAPAVGYEYAVVGNTGTSSRQGGLFLTADDSGAPFLDIYDGVAAHTDFNTNSKTKARLGKLTGITDSFFGTLTGYGLWTNSVYINGGYINGSLVIGPGVGFSVAPMLHLPFNRSPGAIIPNLNGHLGQAPIASTQTGCYAGPGKFRGAIAPHPSISNLLSNSSIESNATDYATDRVGATVTRSAEFSMFGNYSLKWSGGGSSGAANAYYLKAGTIPSASTTYFSVYVRRADGGVVSGVSMYIDSTAGTLTPTITPVGDSWYRVWGSRTIAGVPGNQVVGLTGLDTATAWYFDGWQTQGGGISPYVEGSSGGTVLEYTSFKNIDSSRGSWSAWVWVDSYNSNGGMLWAAGSTNAALDCYITAAGALTFRVNSQSLAHGTTVTTMTWHHVACVWDISNGTQRVYLDGVASSAGSPGSSTPTLGSTIGIGYSPALASVNYNHIGYLSDVAFLNRALTANEVLAIYNSNAPLNVTRSNYELTLADPSTTAKVVANAYGIFGTDASAKPTFSLVNVNSTVNGESLTTGDTLLGDNSSSKGNVLFDQSAGSLIIRTGTTNVLSFSSAGLITGVLNLDTNGGIYQGSSGSFSSVPGSGTGIKIWRGNGTTDGGAAGDCIIGVFDSGNYTMSITPSAAVTIVGGTAFDGKRAVNFVDSAGTRVGEVYGYSDSSTYNAVRVESYANSSTRDSYAYIMSAQENSSGKATAQIIATNFTSPSTLNRPTATVSNFINSATPLASVTLEVKSKIGSIASLTLQDSNGTITWAASGVSKSWRIDHPLTPTTHWLDHATVEGPDNYTFYRGNVTLDSAGHAIVQMPDWFDALNDDLVITYGDWGDATRARTSHRIPNGWVIVGQPRQRVSWMASGVRADAWARAHPFQVETEKNEANYGKVFAWQEHGYDESYAPPSAATQQPAGQ